MKIKVINLIILDESGSMESIKKAAIDGLNETIQSIQAAQTKHGEVQEHYLTFVSFNTNGIRTIFDHRPVAGVGLVTDYRPGACTPLYDAMGFSLTELRDRLNREEQNRVLVTIITDGYENASREYTGAAIKKLVEELKAQGWVFTYIGTNQDVDAVADSLSIDHKMHYHFSVEGTGTVLKKERSDRERFFNKVSAMSFDANVNLNEKYFEEESIFYLDNHLWEHIEALLPEEQYLREEFKKDLEWFQDEHIKGGRSQHYGHVSKENYTVMKEFERYMRGKAYARHLNIELIMSMLQKRYL
ncbi:MAG: hypothetical protein LBR10_03025 [Prevotellaceae bacterium]|jgi:hypothetical protein|nr:hypothetical protein [Prevotellaceae bacterium]